MIKMWRLCGYGQRQFDFAGHAYDRKGNKKYDYKAGIFHQGNSGEAESVVSPACVQVDERSDNAFA